MEVENTSLNNKSYVPEFSRKAPSYTYKRVIVFPGLEFLAGTGFPLVFDIQLAGNLLDGISAPSRLDRHSLAFWCLESPLNLLTSLTEV